MSEQGELRAWQKIGMALGLWWTNWDSVFRTCYSADGVPCPRCGEQHEFERQNYKTKVWQYACGNCRKVWNGTTEWNKLIGDGE